MNHPKIRILPSLVVLSSKFSKKTCLGYWWHLTPNFMPIVKSRWRKPWLNKKYSKLSITIWWVHWYKQRIHELQLRSKTCFQLFSTSKFTHFKDFSST